MTHFSAALTSLTLLFLASCMSAGDLTKTFDADSHVYRNEFSAETRKTHQQLVERRRLQARLDEAQDREAELRAGGVAPSEETELRKLTQEIALRKKQLSALASAG